MKSKVLIWGTASLLLMLVACKSTPSGYKNVYEAAQARSTVKQDAPVTPVPSYSTPVAPNTPSTPSQSSFRVEKLTSVDGTGIKQFSVVIGSFVNKTNAESLKNRMKTQGYNALLAQNEKEMYRVIVATFDNKSDAISALNALKEKFAPNFSDAWLLEQGYY
ncbi:MAG: SPOR domain-containing protein [Dysgonamonadaceae bacterium]|jgi:cell division septation protein DedD|nr:SPOR domain-containing protein [Dysgonamonadaceae bacterium]